MANFTEKIVKLSDYPFSYSILGLMLLILTNTKFEIIDNDLHQTWAILIIAGLLGTMLSIIDPIGRLIRFYLRPLLRDQIFISLDKIRYWILGPWRAIPQIPSSMLLIPFKKIQDFAKMGQYRESDLDHRIVEKEGYDYYKEKRYESRIISTNWISFEIDKIVSIVYFSIIVALIIYVLNTENLYSIYANLSDSSTSKTPEFDSFFRNIRPFLLGIFVLSFALLILIIIHSVKKLSKRIVVIKEYFFMADNLDKYGKYSGQYEMLVEQTKNLLTYINARDWGMAEFFSDAINNTKNKTSNKGNSD